MTSNSDGSWILQSTDPQVDSQLKQKIIAEHKSVTISCRDKNALQDARDLVPIAELVQNNLDILDGDYHDNLLPILTKWFSEDFFTWFTPPSCEKCTDQLTDHSTSINPEGLLVETYRCINSNLCDFKYDFIRHNDPAILLFTRRGRCGEWASCFYLILRAMDYEARVVLDTTDHLWNEVWSESQERWIHVDPCEAVVDNPLLYELGWSKKLEYCIAFSEHEVTDVTCRYTRDINIIRQTRLARNPLHDQKHELSLARFLDKLTNEAIEHKDEATRAKVLKRRMIDLRHLKDFETKGRPDLDARSMSGRKTGSVAWRIARGEFSPILDNLKLIKVQSAADGIDGCLFSLQYDCDKNVYISSSADLNIKGWQNLTYHAENVDHKYEREWKTSYIARYESCPANVDGKIQWRFDMAAVDSWNRIEIILTTKIWSDTQLRAELVVVEPGNKARVTRELELNKVNAVTMKELGAARLIDLFVLLGGGKSDDSVAWQKPQLFRQMRGERSDERPFSFRVF